MTRFRADRVCHDNLLFQLTCACSAQGVRDALAAVRANVDALCLDVDQDSAIELVLAEALNNIVEHSYGNAPQGGPIHIFGYRATDGLHLRVTDQGRAMPGGRLPCQKTAARGPDPADLPEGGFGWHLIAMLTSGLSYCRQGSVNCLDLHFNVSRTANSG